MERLQITSWMVTISMIMVNVVSLVALTYLFAADMVEQGGGRILNVESTAGFMPVSWPVFHLKNDCQHYCL